MLSYKNTIVTPEMAKEFLKHNTNNRALRETWVEQLAKLITNGKWCKDVGTISIGDNGVVIDGQHRLSAIVKANIAVEVTIVTGVSDEAYKWIDSGIKRTTPDRIHLVNDNKINKCICLMIVAYIRASQGKNHVSIDMIENEFLKTGDSFTFVATAFHKPVKALTLSPIGAAFACYHSKYPAEASATLENYLSGQDLEKGDPILVLREALFSGRMHCHLSVWEIYWKTINVLRHRSLNKKMAHISCCTKDFRDNVYDQLLWKNITRGKKAAEKVAESRSLTVSV